MPTLRQDSLTRDDKFAPEFGCRVAKCIAPGKLRHATPARPDLLRRFLHDALRHWHHSSGGKIDASGSSGAPSSRRLPEFFPASTAPCSVTFSVPGVAHTAHSQTASTLVTYSFRPELRRKQPGMSSVCRPTPAVTSQDVPAVAVALVTPLLQRLLPAQHFNRLIGRAISPGASDLFGISV
jgi:hypothetical protein